MYTKHHLQPRARLLAAQVNTSPNLCKDCAKQPLRVEARSCPKKSRISLLRSVHTSAVAPEFVSEVVQEEIEEAPDATFHTIYLDGCEFLIASSGDRLLDLTDVYVKDNETEIFARPSTEGSLPDSPARYIEMEWAEECTGDTLMQKPAWRKVHRVYLVPVTQEDPFRVNLEEVYSLDSSERMVRREAVFRATEERDPTLITLRIRPEGVFIEENEGMISDFKLAEEYLYEKEVERVEKAEASRDALDEDVDWKEDSGAPRDPIDALNDDEREYDESFEDTPAVDQGF